MRKTTRRSTVFTLLLAVLGSNIAHATQTANVSVNAASSLGNLPNSAFGVNTAVWDGNLLDPAVPGLLKNAGVNLLRFPGGSTADAYHWQTNSATSGTGQYINPNDTFDNFMGMVSSAGGSAIITVNYGSNSNGTAGGDPAEAASWVHYANVAHGYGIKYWEIGNEIYGNGEYGAAWETDKHSSHTPTTYGTNCVSFATAMKAQDPSIKVGAVLTAPGNWPDGQSPDWNSGVLAACGSSIDFVIVHWYAQGPGSESDSGLLASTSSIASMVSKVRALIKQYCGSNAPNVQILVTETNSVSYNPGKQTVSLVNGLFLADDFMDWMENGVANVDWWDLHNSISTGQNNSASLYGSAQYGDYGLLSDGTSAGGQTEPTANTPFPPYFGLQMLTHLGKPGDAMVSTSSNQPLVAAHAVRQANGSLALLLIDKDSINSYGVNITINGYAPGTSATRFFYGEGSTSITSSPIAGVGVSFTETIPPYSLTTIVMTPGVNSAALHNLALQNTSSQQLAFWYTNGTNITSGLYPTSGGGPAVLPPNWLVRGEADFNSDGFFDLVLQNMATGQLAIWFTNGTNITSGVYVTLNGSPAVLPPNWVVAGVGDFNGDGAPDLALENTSTGALAFWFLNGTTVASGVYATMNGSGIALPVNWQIMGAGDFNGDGKADLLLQNASTGQLVIWFVNGAVITSGTYVMLGGSPAAVPPNWQVRGIADYDGDGSLDLALENTSAGQLAFWLMNGTTVTSGAYGTQGGSAAIVPPNWVVAGSH